MKKLMLLDGNSLINRAFYGVRPLNAPDGTPTNAVYGFLAILQKLLEDEAPDGLAVAFDAAPNYAANQVRFERESEMTNAHDLLGETAMDAVAVVLQDKDPELQKLWKEACGHEE